MANGSMTTRESSDVTVIDVKEDLGSYVASDLRETLEDLLGSKTQKIIVNLGNVKHINSTGRWGDSWCSKANTPTGR